MREIAEYTPPKEVLEHFNASPTAAKYLADKDFIILETLSRQRPEDAYFEDSLLSKTLKTPDTIPHTLSLLRPAQNASGLPCETVMFFSMASGLNGHPNISHGGIVGVMLDEIMGLFCSQVSKTEHFMTVMLKINYKRPTRTPGIIVGRAWLNKVDGRKMFVDGELIGRDGHVCATAESIYVEVDRTARARNPDGAFKGTFLDIERALDRMDSPSKL